MPVLLASSQIIGKEIFANDEKKIGKAVNVLVDFLSAQVEIVVFPHLVSKLIRDHSGKIAGMVAGQAISAIKHVIPGAEIADIIIDEAGGYAGGRAGGRVKQLFTTIQESYYSIPVSFLGQINSESIRLLISYEDCRKWSLNAVPVPEIQMCLVAESEKDGTNSPTPISLNLPAMKNILLRDASGMEASVVDIAVPVPSDSGNSGEMSPQFSPGIVVIDPRPSVQRGRLVPVTSITRQGSNRFVSEKTLDQCAFVSA